MSRALGGVLRVDARAAQAAAREGEVPEVGAHLGYIYIYIYIERERER